MIFQREQLQLMTIPQLRKLTADFGLRPTGSAAMKDGYITTLLAFPELALRQFEDGRGVIRPTFDQLQIIGKIVDHMGEPTPEQKALLQATYKGHKMSIPRRYDQERFFNLYKASVHLSLVVELLGEM